MVTPPAPDAQDIQDKPVTPKYAVVTEKIEDSSEESEAEVQAEVAIKNIPPTPPVSESSEPLPAPPEPEAAAAAETKQKPASLTKTDSEISEFSESRVIERHSSADSSVSSPSSSPSQVGQSQPDGKTGPTIEARTSSSSSGSSAGGPDNPDSSDSEQETESDLPLPPDQLELKQRSRTPGGCLAIFFRIRVTSAPGFLISRQHGISQYVSSNPLDVD